MEIEEAFEIFDAAVGWPLEPAVIRVLRRVRREFREGVAIAQQNGNVERLTMVLRRAQLEVKLLYRGWPGWAARVVAEVYPRRALPPLLTHEM